MWDKVLERRWAESDDEKRKEAAKLLDGAVICDVGHVSTSREGGLTFDVTKNGKLYRVVLGYNDCGLWVEWVGERGVPSEEDVLLARVSEFIDHQDYDAEPSVVGNPRDLTYTIKQGSELTLTIKEIKMLGLGHLFVEKVKPFDVLTGLMLRVP